MATVNIKGCDQAAVLEALCRAAIPGALHGGYRNATPPDRQECEAFLDESTSFSYVNGRAIFVTFEGDELHVHEYDAKNGGPGTAAKALAPLIEASDRDFAAKMRDLGVPVP